MDYRDLGRSGLKVSPLCLGTMMLGRWGNTDEAECIRIVHRAHELLHQRRPTRKIVRIECFRLEPRHHAHADFRMGLFERRSLGRGERARQVETISQRNCFNVW